MTQSSCLIVLALTLQVPAPRAAGDLSTELSAAQRGIAERERTDLTKLVDRLKHDGDSAGATAVSSLWLTPIPNSGASRFLPFPDVIGPAKSRALANLPAQPAKDADWQGELQKVRQRSAQEFSDLAKKAATRQPKHYALADECLREVIARQPDHAEARRLLGFVPHEGGWATPYAVRQLRAGKQLHRTYGWVPKDWIPHLEKGELPAPPERGQSQARWLPADEADMLHAPWEKAWQIATEHFVVRTNVPLAEAIVFSRRLEDFHQLFFALLADLFGEGLPQAQRWHNPKRVGEPEVVKPHEVYYFATQQEFVDFIVPLEGPGVAKSLGLYIPPRGKQKHRPAYFFRDTKEQLPVTATLYHEVSHQLLFESGLGDPEGYKKNVGNYWVFEGLGTYFETLEHAPDGALEVGGLVGKRIEYARARLAGNQEYIPLEEFVSYSQERFNTDKVVFLHYQEANALAVFFMQANDRKYREGFLDYVSDAFKGRVGRASGRSLESRLGLPYKDLDAEFLAYLKGGAAP